MILEYHCRNYRSIGEEVTFSLLASGDDSLEKNVAYDEAVSRNILRSAVLYGGNGSGKSNFIDSLNYLKSLVTNSLLLQPGDPLPFDPHKLLDQENTMFKIHFTKGSKRFLYYVELNSKRIEKEYLYFYPNNRVSKVFEREGEEISFAKQFQTSLLPVSKSGLKANRLFLSCAANSTNVETVVEAFKFFNSDLVILNKQENWLLYSARSMESSSEMKRSVLDFLRKVGEKDLIGISSKVEEKSLDGSRNFDQRFLENFKSSSAIRLDYGLFSLDYGESSEGIKKLIRLLPPFLDAIKKDKAFFVDEFESHLHPLLVSSLLSLFQEKRDSKAQLIFTTHDTNLLSLDTFRRDQIWFTDMKKNHMSELFSLAEVRAVRKDENIARNYLLGKYRGIPMIDPEKKTALLEDEI